MKKIISFVLAALLLVSAVPMAHATNDYTAGTKVEYTAANNEAYTITVPAQLAPGGSGTVTLEGTWASDRVVSVTADKNVKLTNSINAADQKTLDVSFPGIDEYGSNTTRQTFTETVSVANIADALFGTWSGRFYYNVNVYDSVEYLQSKYDFEYYSTMNLAVTDVNNGTIGASADSDKGAAVAGIYTDENGSVNIVLLQDTTEETSISPSVDMTINLGGHTLSTNDKRVIYVVSGDLTIDGSLHGSTINISHDDDIAARAIQIMNDSNVTINGGTYICKSNRTKMDMVISCWDSSSVNIMNADIIGSIDSSQSMAGVYFNSTGATTISNCNITATATQGGALGIYDNNSATISNCNIIATSTQGSARGINVYPNHSVTISDCDITATAAQSNAHGINVSSNSSVTISNCDITATADEQAIGVYTNSNATATISDCEITATATTPYIPEETGQAFGVMNDGSLIMNNCIIKGYANYGSVNGSYVQVSQGMQSNGVATLNDCHIIGTHSGVASFGALYVNGGTYEGYGHGGFYFSSSDTTSYVRNATIRQCAMPDGYNTNMISNQSGFYIGGRAGRDNISIYMDNCDIYGSGKQIVLRGSDGEQNNSLYISDSNIYDMDGDTISIRIDNNTHKLYIGTGNNFTADNTTLPEAVVITDETYTYNG